MRRRDPLDGESGSRVEALDLLRIAARNLQLNHCGLVHLRASDSALRDDVEEPVLENHLSRPGTGEDIWMFEGFQSESSKTDPQGAMRQDARRTGGHVAPGPKSDLPVKCYGLPQEPPVQTPR